ncbi:MAG TPA: hypothetical protein VM451_09295 [Candidatus Limnocylindria bacterium]|nr:hypothetical protein [Candidatus Limnocylindria bacterium]
MTSCDEGVLALWGSPEGSVPVTLQMQPGAKVAMFVVDVDGRNFGVAVIYPIEGGTQDGNSQVQSIFSSLRFQPLP